MGASYRHTGDRCGYAVETSGPWEFYRDQAGMRQPYGHPVPRSREAKERGIAGFSALMYCTICDQVVDVIVQEYPTAIGEALGATLQLTTSWCGVYWCCPGFQNGNPTSGSVTK
jgi:hypothetical protein